MRKLEKRITYHFRGIETLWQTIDASPRIYLTQEASQSLNVLRRCSNSFKPMNEVVVIDRVEVRSDVERDAMRIGFPVLTVGAFEAAIRQGSFGRFSQIEVIAKRFALLIGRSPEKGSVAI
jgi:hypothetical protein